MCANPLSLYRQICSHQLSEVSGCMSNGGMTTVPPSCIQATLLSHEVYETTVSPARHTHSSWNGFGETQVAQARLKTSANASQNETPLIGHVYLRPRFVILALLVVIGSCFMLVLGGCFFADCFNHCYSF